VTEYEDNDNPTKINGHTTHALQKKFGFKKIKTLKRTFSLSDHRRKDNFRCKNNLRKLLL